MTDLRALNDAFAELERRADVASASAPALHQRSRTHRLMPVAAAAAVVAGLAAGTVWLLPGGGDSSSVAAGNAPTTSEPAATSPVAAPAELPRNSEELIVRFAEVLGDTATFHVDEGPNVPPDLELPTGKRLPVRGGAIVGTLTASGVTGGFGLLVHQSEDPRKVCLSGCETLPDGSELFVDEQPLEGSTGVTYETTLYRADGAKLSLHVSSVRSPNGPSEDIAPQPPLTTDQMTEIITSDLW